MTRVTIHVEVSDQDEPTNLDFLAVMMEVMEHVEADGIVAFWDGGLHKSIERDGGVCAVLNATMNVRGVPQ